MNLYKITVNVLCISFMFTYDMNLNLYFITDSIYITIILGVALLYSTFSVCQAHVFFHYKGVKLWNNLENEMKMIENLSDLK